MTIFFGTVRSTKTCKMGKVHGHSHDITNKPLQVRTTKTLWYQREKQTIIMLRSVPQMLKKWRIVINSIPKVRQTTCNWIKKILDEAARIIVNVFLISWFFYLFLLCSISLLVKYDFILRYEAWVNAIRMFSFIENFPEISAKPIAFQWNLLGEALTKSAVLYQSFLSETGLENSCEIPTKLTVFLWICPWKSREIWLFFPRPTRSPGVVNERWIIVIKSILSPAVNNVWFVLFLFLEISSYIWQWRRDDVWRTKSLCHILFITSWSWLGKRGSRSYPCLFGWCYIQVWCGSYASSKCCNTVTWLCLTVSVQQYNQCKGLTRAVI